MFSSRTKRIEYTGDGLLMGCIQQSQPMKYNSRVPTVLSTPRPFGRPRPKGSTDFSHGYLPIQVCKIGGTHR
ncbi:hypothetical protein HU200_037614 [Digitaria exilis]|uniref:Uncharacterized protein n=1 Tax=Digitaria exilis TaxID=1010633 RepID=A0A835BK26_9POAL|nr:hypothetical protein HU200_037614 [Digitaria exilis]